MKKLVSREQNTDFQVDLELFASEDNHIFDEYITSEKDAFTILV